MRDVAKKKPKVLVALSGGVDSAVAAALLKKQGLEVAGVFFRFFNGTASDRSPKKAKKISKALRISLKIVDARKEFKKKIIDYFIDAYEKGLTPNPCVVCNKEMKFRLLFSLMKKYKFDYVATGHYALIKIRPFLPAPREKRGSQDQTLREAKDRTKDQSYFLYRLTQKDLAKITFPLGDYRKSEVKKLAKKFKLPTLKEESQDICFLEGREVGVFLKNNIWLKPGNIIGQNRNILGKHKGLPLYTLGQRKGIEIGGTGPYWVIGKNLRNNELVVTNNPKKLLTKNFFVSGANWISGQPKFPLRARVQTRYRAERFSAIIRSRKSGRLAVETRKPLRAVTPGQAAVFYKGGEVLGGGIII